MSLWHIPTSNSEARERPKLVQTKPPPLDFSKMKSGTNHSAANAHARPMFRMPKSKFTRPKNRATFAVPVGMLKHASSSSDESSSDDEVAILERDRLEIERIRKKRMNEKGIGLYNRTTETPYGQQSSYQHHDPIEEQRQLQEEIEELKRQEEVKREEERQKTREAENQRRQDDEKRRKQLERNKRNAELRRRKEEEQLEVEKREKIMEERRNSLLERKKTKMNTKMENTNRSEHYKKTLKQELTPLQKYKKEEQERERAELERREKEERERREKEAKEEEEKEQQRLARRLERQRREQAEKQMEQQRKQDEERRRVEKEKREKEQKEAEEKYRAQKLEDERLKQKEIDDKRKRAEEVRKRAERALSSSNEKKESNKKTNDQKNDQVRKELESIKAEVNATFAKKPTTQEKEPERKKQDKMAFSHFTQSMEPVTEQRYVAPKRYGLYAENEEIDNGIKITSSRGKDKTKDAEARRRAEENRKWIESMTVKKPPPKKIENTSNINPNILAAVTHTDQKPLVQPIINDDMKQAKTEQPKIETTKEVNPRDALIEKLKDKKTDSIVEPETKDSIVVVTDTADELKPMSVVVDDPIKPADEPIKEKKKKKTKLESIPQETELEPFTDDDDEDLFQLKTFEINYMWTWDVTNETCAICRSSLMELSPNQMSDENTVVIIWGECGHSFHNGCMAQWTRNNPRCPLCQQDWVVSRISREH